MCGLIAAFNRSPKNKKNKHMKAEKVNTCIMDQYQDQCNRGQKGFGIIRITEKGKIQVDRATQENKFLLDLYLRPGNMILAHHRQPTSTDNKMVQTHPIFVSNKLLKHDYYFMHNGMVGNDSDLHKKHIDMGFAYTTEYHKEGYGEYYKGEQKWNDTEALAIEVAMVIEEMQPNVETNSGATFLALQINKKTNIAEKLYFGRNGSHTDLNIYQDEKKGILRISSEGIGDAVEENKLCSFDINDKDMVITKKDMVFKKKEIPEAEEKTKTGVTVIDFEHKHHNHNNPVQLPMSQNLVKIETTTEEIPSDFIKGHTPGNEKAMVVIQERKWISPNIQEDPYQDFDDSCFVDKKSYSSEMCKETQENLKTDDSTMVETSIETLLDDQKDKITSIIELYEKTLLKRKIVANERNYYMSQVYHIMKAMESMADLAEEEYELKSIEEEARNEEEAYSDEHVGFHATRKVYRNFKTGEMEERTGDIDFEKVY